jgi:hypothetical protein
MQVPMEKPGGNCSSLTFRTIPDILGEAIALDVQLSAYFDTLNIKNAHWWRIQQRFLATRKRYQSHKSRLCKKALDFNPRRLGRH